MSKLKRSIITTIILGALLLTGRAVYAHVGISSSPNTACPSLDSTDFKVHTLNQIDNRISGLSTTTSMTLFSTRGDSVTATGATTTPWVRNTSVWTNVGTDINFTGVSAWTQMYDGYSSHYQHVATLISPKHFVTAHHWGITDNATVAFVANDNTVIYRTVVDTVQVGNTDIQVGVLDSDVPDTVTYYPIMASSTLRSIVNSYTNTEVDFPIVTFNSSTQSLGVDKLLTIASESSGVTTHQAYTSGKKSEFATTLIGGDSGNPGFVIIDNQPVLLFTHYSTSGGPQHGAYISEINTAINTLGSGYQVTEYSPTCFTTFTKNAKPSITKAFPEFTPQVTNPATSLVDPVITFNASDADTGNTLTLSIESITANGTTTPIVLTDLFTVSTTTTSLSLTPKVGISESIYGSTLTLLAKVTDSVSLNEGVATTTATISVRDIPSGEKRVRQADFGTLDFDSQAKTLLNYDNNYLFYAGSITKTNFVDNNLGLTDMSGNLNPVFNANVGVGTRNNTNTAVITQALSKDSLNRILVGGDSVIYSYNATNLATPSPLIRINSDGTLDSTFQVNMGTSSSPRVTGLATVGSDVFVAGTFSTINGTSIKRVARINSDGTLNSTFNTNYGTGTAGLSGGINITGGVLQDGGTNIYVFGAFASYVSPSNVTTTTGRIAKFNIDGTFDTTFAANSGTGFNGTVYEAKIRPDGKIVAMGVFTAYNGTTVNRIALINPDGTLDSTFATNIGTAFASNPTQNTLSLGVLSNNKILVGTNLNAFNGRTTGLFFALNSDGTLDEYFLTSIGLGVSVGQISEILVRPDDSVVLGVGGSFVLDTYPVPESVSYLRTITPITPTLRVLNNRDVTSTNYINSNTAVFSGFASTTATVALYSGSTLVATSTANSNGTWTATTTLAEGAHTINIVQALKVLDLATSSTSTVQVVVDLTIPSAPVITSPTVGEDIGLTKVITGSCETGSVVVLSNNYLTDSYATTTCSGGTYSFDASFILDAVNSAQTISVTSYDFAGNNSATTTRSVDVIGLTDAPTSLTRTSDDTDTTPTFTTSCQNGNTVYLYQGSTQIASGVCSGGTVTLTTNTLSLGSHSVVAIQNGASGLSAASSLLNFNITETISSNSFGSSAGGGSLVSGNIVSQVNQASQLPAVNISDTYNILLGGSYNLVLGSTGTSIRELQQYLNSNGFPVSLVGAGSAGNETNYFGLKTKIALARYQASVGIYPATGVFGAKTRLYILQQSGKVRTVKQEEPKIVGTTTPLCATDIYLTSPVRFGAKNNQNDVRLLEKFLNTYEGARLSVNGIYEKNDFDAVVSFQEKYAKDVLVPYGNLKRGTGYVYVTTLKKIKEIVSASCK